MYLTHNCIIMLSLLANKLPLPPLSTAKLTDFSPPPTFSLPSHFSLSLSLAPIFLRLVDLVRNYSKMLERPTRFEKDGKVVERLEKKKKNGRKNVYFSRERDGERFQTRMA